ncbi:type I DNA topoisomerase [Zongyangia hominis]|uniref:DNA topoisomerase 1 n=1 Tax=Zongyangia hominis TaxID=2763677 RepID=A0A926IAJ2_9FIRM|nr:type I DNA topoisomerase [Zongyangia hominis]MBC8569253.1 type I DNA topoisomerase [Zongyangia hominis]
MSNLVIVESPAKAKTIQKYLGKDFDVIASMGHIRDLPKSRLGVDVDNNFEPHYIAIKGKEEIIRNLKAKAKKSDQIYLATDPDREGEAISWHLAHLLKIPTDDQNRVTFNEITKSGVQSGMDHPRKIDQDLVDAQQARRILDRIVGYKISPFLWKKIKSGLSGGRVQSVAVRMIVDREEEIRAFKAEEYWSIDAKLTAKGSRKVFASKLHSKDGEKVEIKNEEQANAILADLKDAPFIVANVKKGVRKKTPAPPFITSTLQQEASRRLGFQARRTMKAAQELYEGVDVEGMGPTGLITYMRTDSLRISDEARAESEAFIVEKYGKQYLPQTRRVFKTKSSAQDAHEAIRPSMPALTPDRVKGSLTSDQFKLYKLIWERFIASQMANALLDTVSADISANNYTFKSSGYSVKFDGFTVLYEESKDGSEDSEESGVLPPLTVGDPLKVKSLDGSQHFTQPPPRYTEASIIKALEENEIGRPSTYAPTISTILTRGYIEREAKQLKPTALGEITTKVLSENFANIVDVAFTAKMEKDLDRVELGKANWVKTLDHFYKDFAKTLEAAEKTLDGTKIKVPDEETDVVCELCGRKMVIKNGRYGKFLACPGFPECRNTKKIVQETPGVCPICKGKVLAKKSKNGKSYFGCENNPKCSFMTWDEPLAEKCPKCDASLFKKRGKNGKIYCGNENCDYERGLKD